MKLHIEHLTINLNQRAPSPGLLATLALGAIGKNEPPAAPADIPQVGELWPGTDATYAGLALSSDETSLVHLIVWPEEGEDLDYEKAMEFATGVKPEMNSHAPTRHQGITLFERLQDKFDKDYCYWLQTKTKSGKAAFVQNFSYGYQGSSSLTDEFRVRAVSEIPL